MKPWIKRTLAAVLGSVLLAGGLAACGHREHGPRSAAVSAEDVAKWRARLLERAGRELALDETQKAKLGTLFDTLDAQRRALVGSTPDPRAELRALVAGPSFDRARAQALVGEKTDVLRGRSPEVIAAAADFYDGLNAGQQAKVRAWLERRHGRG